MKIRGFFITINFKMKVIYRNKMSNQFEMCMQMMRNTMIRYCQK